MPRFLSFLRSSGAFSRNFSDASAEAPLQTSARFSASTRGIFLVCLSVVLFTLSDSATKYLSAFYPVAMIICMRFLLHMSLVLLVFLPRLRTSLFHSQYPKLQILRGLLLISATLCFTTALKYMGMAEALAIAFVAPLLVTLLAVRFLGEKVTKAHLVAIYCGFFGVLVVIRPGGDVFSWASILPLINAVFFGVYQLLTKKVSEHDKSATSAFYAGFVGSIITLCLLPFFWVTPMNLWHAALFISGGLLGGIAHIALIRAFSFADASQLTPFSYTQMIWGVLGGFLFFGDLPDRWTFVGMFIIIASGLFIATRKRVENPLKKAS